MKLNVLVNKLSKSSCVLYGLIVVLTAVVIVMVLAVLGPAVGNIFSNQVNISRECGCAWQGKVKAFVDANGNGTYDDGEPPLSSVKVSVVVHVPNSYGGSGSPCGCDVGTTQDCPIVNTPGLTEINYYGTEQSDLKGNLSFFLFMAGDKDNCNKAINIEYQIQSPAGYKLSSQVPSRIPSDSYCHYVRPRQKRQVEGEALKIGFQRLPGYPTLTPPLPLVCEQIQEMEGHRTVDIIHGLDNSLLFLEDNLNSDPSKIFWRYGIANKRVEEFVIYTPDDVELLQMNISSAGDILLKTENSTSHNDLIFHYDGSSTKLVDFGEHQFRSIVPDSDSTLWLLTDENTVLHFNPSRKSYSEISLEQDVKKVNKYSSFSALSLSTDQSLWFWENYPGTVFHYAKKNETELALVEYFGLPEESIIHLFFMPDSSLWVFSEKGMYQRDIGKKQWIFYNFDGRVKYDLPFYSDTFSKVAVDSSGKIWLAVGDAGLVSLKPDRQTPENSEWRMYNQEDGLGGDYANAVLVTPNGDLWVAMENGVTRCHQVDK